MELVISPKAAAVIELLKKSVNNSLTGVSFLSIKNYTSASTGETANHLVNIGINYAKAKAKDIETLKNLDIKEHTFKSDLALIEEARQALIAELTNPNANRSQAQIDAYTPIVDGLKVHNESGKLIIYAFREKKTVISEGTYKTVKSRPLTIAKDELRKLLRVGKFKNFAIELGNELKANGETLEL